MIIAHRGFSSAAPENTLPAFELALAAEADLVELDVRQARDGEWLVFHDRELDRATDAIQRWGKRHIQLAAKTSTELRTLDAGRWFDPRFAGTKVPLLSEALELIQPRSSTLIERKAGSAADLAHVLRQRNLIQEVLVQSFDWEFLCQLRQCEPKLGLGALGPAHRLPGGKRPLGISRKLNRRWLDQAAKTGAQFIAWNRNVSRGGIRLAHERGLRVFVYTINTPRLALRFGRMEVDGIITNDLALMRSAFPLFQMSAAAAEPARPAVAGSP